MNQVSPGTPRASNASVLFLLALGCLLPALPADAHPGHGLFGHGATHAFTSPFHLLGLALVGAGLFLGAKFIRSPKIQQLTRAAGGTAILLSIPGWALNP